MAAVPQDCLSQGWGPPAAWPREFPRITKPHTGEESSAVPVTQVVAVIQTREQKGRFKQGSIRRQIQPLTLPLLLRS